MITIALKRDVSGLITDVERLILDQGGRFCGDDKSGHFSGKTVLGNICGNYTIVSGEIQIEITRKPRLLSTKRIAAELGSYFS